MKERYARQIRAEVDTCKRGHPQAENLYTSPKGETYCRACYRQNRAMTGAQKEQARRERDAERAARDQRILDRYVEGWRLADIGAEMGVSSSTVADVTRRAGLKRGAGKAMRCDSCKGPLEAGRTLDCVECVATAVQIWREEQAA